LGPASYIPLGVDLVYSKSSLAAIHNKNLKDLDLGKVLSDLSAAPD